MGDYMHYFEQFIIPFLSQIGISLDDYHLPEKNPPEVFSYGEELYTYELIKKKTGFKVIFTARVQESGVRISMQNITVTKSYTNDEINEKIKNSKKKQTKKVHSSYEKKAKQKRLRLELVNRFMFQVCLKMKLDPPCGRYTIVLKGDNSLYLRDELQNLDYKLYGTRPPSIKTKEWVLYKRLRAYVQNSDLKKINYEFINQVYPNKRVALSKILEEKPEFRELLQV